MTTISVFQMALEQDEKVQFDEIMLTYPVTKKEIILARFIDNFIYMGIEHSDFCDNGTGLCISGKNSGYPDRNVLCGSRHCSIADCNISIQYWILSAGKQKRNHSLCGDGYHCRIILWFIQSRSVDKQDFSDRSKNPDGDCLDPGRTSDGRKLLGLPENLYKTAFVIYKKHGPMQEDFIIRIGW